VVRTRSNNNDINARMMIKLLLSSSRWLCKGPMKRKLFSLFLVLASALPAADDLIITMAHVEFRVADLEKTREYYTGVLQIPLAYERKDASGKITSVFLQINRDQFLGFSQGSPVGLNHPAFLTQKIEAVHKLVEDMGLNPPPLRTGTDGTRNFALPVLEKLRVEFTQYEPDSLQARSGKSSKTVLAIESVGVPVADPESARDFFKKSPGFREAARYIEFLPASAPVRLRLRVRKPSSLRAGPDPDGILIEPVSDSK
jgi:catechol 2,3-dioxygenase-like lactoylglutathione lyase family enzyme